MKGLIYVLMTVILMHTLPECRGFQESCVLIHTLFLDFRQKMTELQMPTVMSYLMLQKGVWITYSL